MVPRMSAARRIATSVLTGFLGSGKTTLLNRLLAHPAFKDAAVLINELGEIAIDHLLVRNVDENILRMSTGCLCCAMRGDMIGTMRDLYARRARREIPRFRRMLIETTGLADPAPILHTLMRDPLVGERFRLDGVITTVDALNGEASLDNQRESVKQAAMADRLLLTKTDLADEPTIGRLCDRLRRLNASAPIERVTHGEIDPQRLLDLGLYDAQRKGPDVIRWLAAERLVGGSSSRLAMSEAGVQPRRHDDGVRTFGLVFEAPFDWPLLADALQGLTERFGQDLLRIKGIVNVRGEVAPVVIHGVQHVFHPPVALERWPDADRRSRIVFITRGIERETIEHALRVAASA